jgi:hypothetical protein
MGSLNIHAIQTIADLRKPLEALGFNYQCGHNVNTPGYVRLMGVTEGILRVKATSRYGRTVLEYKLPDKLAIKCEYETNEKLLKRVQEIIAKVGG